MRRFSTKASSTYGHMATMPRLPVPALAATCDLYLRSVKPLLTDVQLQATKAAVADFQRPGGVGETLHRALVEHAKGELNWLEKWWDIGYLEIRTSASLSSTSSPPLLRVCVSEFWCIAEVHVVYMLLFEEPPCLGALSRNAWRSLVLL